jgi:hypothetical protein
MGESNNNDPFCEFALRHFAVRYWGADGPGFGSLEELELLPGALPDELPFDLPLPDGSKVVGTFVRPLRYYIFGEVPKSALDVMTFFTSALSRDGWVYVPFGASWGGFARVDKPESGQMSFHHRSRHAGLIVETASYSTTESYMTLSISMDDADPGAVENEIQDGCTDHVTHELRLPVLLPLPGDEQVETNGGSNRDFGFSSGALWTRAPLSVIIEHYASQFEAAGWQQLESRVNDFAAWHSWFKTCGSFAGQAVWSAVRAPEPAAYVVFALAGLSQPGDPSTRSGGVASFSWGSRSD